MKKIITICLIILLGTLFADDDPIEQRLRTFPNNAIFANIQSVDLPAVNIEEIPGNFASGMLGMVMLKDKTMKITPATLVRDKNNFNHVTGYLDGLSKQSVAILPDFQGNIWVVWQLTSREKEWVIDNKLNSWQ